MKKLITTLFIFSFLIFLCMSCAFASNNTQPDQLKIVATIFPEYDWVREILGNTIQDTQLTLLLDDGGDLHNYQPTVDDMVAISEADVFIYVGGHSDAWVADALKDGTNPDRRVINLFDVLNDSLKPLKMVEGMEHHHDHEEHNEPDHDVHEHHHDEKDEHIWLSLRLTEKAVDAIAGQLCLVAPENAPIYAENAQAYIAKLNELDKEYQSVVEHCEWDTLIFADRFPFFYMMDDYGLHYYAAFTGCSAESEASFETIAFLAEKMNQLNAPGILTIENRTHRIPETVIENMENRDKKILVMNSMQSVTAKDVIKGFSYLDVMKKNLEVLKEALQFAM